MTARQEIENEVRNWSKAEVLDLASRLIAIAQGKPEPSKTGDLTRYYGTLAARPSVARVIDEARPFREFFPLPWPDYVD